MKKLLAISREYETAAKIYNDLESMIDEVCMISVDGAVDKLEELQTIVYNRMHELQKEAKKELKKIQMLGRGSRL